LELIGDLIFGFCNLLSPLFNRFTGTKALIL
jgi:hypothetical protein